jgi:hypothetical protein
MWVLDELLVLRLQWGIDEVSPETGGGLFGPAALAVFGGRQLLSKRVKCVNGAFRLVWRMWGRNSIFFEVQSF